MPRPPAREEPAPAEPRPGGPVVVPPTDRATVEAAAAAPPDDADGFPVGIDLVRALLRDQMPQWADLRLTEIEHNGTDHAMVRLGDDLVVRLPRVSWAARTLRIEQEWLPRIADRLPVATPVPVAVGAPSAGYPWPWSVCRWLSGSAPVPTALADPEGLAADLAALIRALRTVDTDGAPATVWPNPLHEEDGRVRGLLARLDGLPGAATIADAWQGAVDSPPCRRRTWIHGDLAPGNLLLRDGRLAAVLDFGAMGLGDPASDLRPAWNLLPPDARESLRTAVGADDAQWARARGWTLLQALAQLDGFADHNAYLAGNARHVLAEISAEVQAGLA